MLFVADASHLVELIPYQGITWGLGDLKKEGQVICIVQATRATG
jgi:hypothetical protein